MSVLKKMSDKTTLALFHEDPLANGLACRKIWDVPQFQGPLQQKSLRVKKNNHCFIAVNSFLSTQKTWLFPKKPETNKAKKHLRYVVKAVIRHSSQMNSGPSNYSNQSSNQGSGGARNEETTCEQPKKRPGLVVWGDL